MGLVSREFLGATRGIISLASDHPGLRSLGGCYQGRVPVSAVARPASPTIDVQPPPRARFPVRSPTHPGKRALLFLPPAPVGPAASAGGYCFFHGVSGEHEGRIVPCLLSVNTRQRHKFIDMPP